MATLKYKDIDKMSEKERQEKLKELSMELIKNKASDKGKIKAKELKRAIARLLTFNRLNPKESIKK
tara:strand:+ start:1030 stop:1227 length:198 start_codon:yes stop_codon:yes gene_type:complete